ncbi:MAG: ethanolamine utilization microcompartment protein EutL [Polyangia bacterium]
MARAPAPQKAAVARAATHSRPPAPSTPAARFQLVPIKPRVLAVRTIADVAPPLAASLGLSEGHTAAGFITCTSDDALYVALDEGTKAAAVDVVYAKSFYAGSAHASGPLSGEVIGCYASHDVDEVHEALAACLRCLEEEAWFYAADARSELAFFPHVVRATGRYLSKLAGLEPGAPMAYLIAPPLEAMIGIDAALKVGGVELLRFFGPPTETNFAGAYLGGDLPSCEAAAEAFAAAVLDVAKQPLAQARSARGSGERLGSAPARPPGPGEGRFRVLATAERLPKKPDHMTHLRDDESLVDKGHPRMVLRGKLDVLQGLILDAQRVADDEGASGLVGDLEDAMALCRQIVGAEVMDTPLAPWQIGGMGPDELQRASHRTYELYGVPFMYPSIHQGEVVARLYLCRAGAREAELACYQAFPVPSATDPGDGGERTDLKLALNRLSSALYVLQCKFVGGHYGVRRKPGPLKGWRPPAKAKTT